MKSSHLVGCVIGILLANASARAGCVNWDLLVERAVSEDPQNAASAIESLRAIGPEAVQRLVEAYPDCAPDDPRWPRIARALDGVGAQCDNYASRLYWYTDLEKAKLASQVSGKPILSLRLLGRLDEDLSCANSRFIRTALYANEEISAALRDRFILHWESVRPVPVITIDFGDGRKIVRTITGNNLHLALDSEGRPIEALPGLCGPASFRGWLDAVETLNRQLGGMGEGDRYLRQHHDRAYRAIVAAWRADLERSGHDEATLLDRPGPRAAGIVPTALEAAPVARTKALIERPLLWAMAPVAQRFQDATSDQMWDAIASLHLDEARLNEASVALMGTKTAATPALVENFERSLALDTVRNRYLLTRRIHEWFVTGQVGDGPNALSERVYAELYLTPGSDPWLGLLPQDTYAALEGNGIVVNP